MVKNHAQKGSMPKKVILLIGDNLQAEDRLFSANGFLTLPYTNGVEPCDAVEQGFQYDCALVDLELPSVGFSHKTGQEVLEHLKRTSRNTPVIIYSNYVSPSYTKPTQADGAVNPLTMMCVDDWPQNLVRIVNQAIEKAEKEDDFLSRTRKVLYSSHA